MDNKNYQSQNQQPPGNSPPPLASQQSSRVMVSQFNPDVQSPTKMSRRLKYSMIIGVPLLMVLLIAIGTYAFYGHGPKKTFVISSATKSMNSSASSPNVTSGTSPTNQAATSTPATTLPTTSTPPVLATTAATPVFTDNGSYAPTSDSLSGTGECSFKLTLPFSLNGPGDVYARIYQSTNSPGFDDYPSGFSAQDATNYPSAGQYSVSTTEKTATTTGPTLIYSDYFTVINVSNNQVLATSTTSQFTCPS